YVVITRLRFIRWTRPHAVEVRSKTHNLVNFMLDRTLRIEAATDERPSERERYRGIKRDDSIIRSARPNGAVWEHGGRCVQSHRSPVRTGWRDVCRERAPWQ